MAVRFASYMAESVTVKRWELHVGRFLFLYAVFFTSYTILAPQVGLPYILASAAFVTTIGLLTDRYRDRFANPRYEWIKIFLLLAAIVIVLVLVWRHEANKPNYEAPRGGLILNSSQQTA